MDANIHKPLVHIFCDNHRNHGTRPSHITTHIQDKHILVSPQSLARFLTYQIRAMFIFTIKNSLSSNITQKEPKLPYSAMEKDIDTVYDDHQSSPLDLKHVYLPHYFFFPSQKAQWPPWYQPNTQTSYILHTCTQ